MEFRPFGAVRALGATVCRHSLVVLSLAVGLVAQAAGEVATSTTSVPPTTRERTIRPLALASGTPQIFPKEVALYAVHGYSAWQYGPGVDAGRRFDLMPAGYTGAANTARLLSFFAISDIHITDKESPAQAPYFGWNASRAQLSIPGLYTSSYTPVALSTTQLLNASVKTVNGLHRQTPFDFGLFLGDATNNTQFNELRWFIDVLDGKFITPSSGAHLGADTIDYQKPFQAAGLDRSIPWYQVIGNHDQFWSGGNYPTPKIQNALVGSTILNIGPSLFAPDNPDATGVYVGVIDGTSPYGDVIKGGPEANYATAPTVAADPSRHSLVTATSLVTGFMSEFFDTASSPVGHGFTQTNFARNTACYTFEPLTSLPLKVIVLDDTCKLPGATSGNVKSHAQGWIDQARLNWLTAELQKGQDAGQLMVIATHIPINPQKDLSDTDPAPQFYSESLKTDAELIDILRHYPNLILLIAGHRHVNTVTPQPSTVVGHPEYGFWEVETPSLRNFPQQFRTFDIRRNADNSISILITDIDPQVEAEPLAAKSRGYAIGDARVFSNVAPTDTTSHAYNAELVKYLTPAMQAKIAGYGTPLGRPAGELGNQTTSVGRAVSFTAAPSSATTYRWQVSTDGGTAWTDLADDATYSGTATATLTIASATASLNGYRYRYLATGSAGTTTSTAATLTVAAVLFPNPLGVAVDSSNNLYVADATNNTIHKVVLSTGVASRLAGSPGALGSTDGTGTAARFRAPAGLALDAAGNLYVADSGNSTVRKITAAGVVTTVAGSATANGSADATGSAAHFSAPVDISFAPSGVIYVADSGNHAIRQITAAGVVTTIAGLAGAQGVTDGGSTIARFNAPTGLAVAGSGQVVISDTGNNTLRTLSAATVATLAGTYGVAGSSNGLGTDALLNGPAGLAIDAAGSVYFVDTQNSTVRKIATDGVVTTVAGLDGIAGLRDGTGSGAWFNKPRDLALDSTGATLYVADTGNSAIRKIALATGEVSTLTITSATGSSSGGSGSDEGDNSGSSSGGGGGALGLWFVAATAVTMLRRRRFR